MSEVRTEFKIKSIEELIVHVEKRRQKLNSELVIYEKAKSGLLCYTTKSRILELELLLMDIRGEG